MEIGKWRLGLERGGLADAGVSIAYRGNGRRQLCSGGGVSIQMVMCIYHRSRLNCLAVAVRALNAVRPTLLHKPAGRAGVARLFAAFRDILCRRRRACGRG